MDNISKIRKFNNIVDCVASALVGLMVGGIFAMAIISAWPAHAHPGECHVHSSTTVLHCGD